VLEKQRSKSRKRRDEKNKLKESKTEKGRCLEVVPKQEAARIECSNDGGKFGGRAVEALENAARDLAKEHGKTGESNQESTEEVREWQQRKEIEVVAGKEAREWRRTRQGVRRV
jgi:hypothetical protein